MSRSLFSSSWHSVAELKPRLIPQANIQRHVYRGKVWYVVQDKSGGKYHRLSPVAYQFVQGMNGSATVQSLWEQANTSGNGDDCTQNEVVDLLVQLHGADLLQIDSNPDSAALLSRYKKKRTATLKQYLLNPMSLKIPLINPDAFLTRWAPAVKWCFSWTGFWIWLAVVLPALVLAGFHWGELTHNISDQLLSSSNLLIMFFVYPVVKLVHEYGHGFATKVWGGAVNEMGLMFLVFAPVPYVNASSSAAFPSKIQRAVVAAAGMMSELFLAAVALFVWLLVEPGLVRAVAYNTMIVAGISTLIVNGNPLLRYDAYYIFSDLIEIPNLAQRGQKYLTYLCDRYLFGARNLEEPQESKSEKRWLFCYTPLAWCYRTFVTVSILLFVAGEFFIFGVLIALWGCVTLVVIPLWKAYRHVVSSGNLHRTRQRAVRYSLAIVAAFLVFFFVIPMPLHTRAQGVVWLPDQAILRAGTEGFFQEWLIQPGTPVQKGDALFRLRDADLEAALEVARAKVAQSQARYWSEQFVDQSKAMISRSEFEKESKTLAQLQEKAERLTGRAKVAGVLIGLRPQDMPQSYLKKGDMIAYVLEKDSLIARIVVSQDDIDLVRSRYDSVQLRFSDWITKVYPATLARQSPGAVNELPTPALGLSGGGSIPTLPSDAEGIQTLDRVFLVDLDLPVEAKHAAFGERVHVRFSHGYEPFGWQAARRLRQLFLSRFGV